MLGTAKVVDWNGSSPLTRGKPGSKRRYGMSVGLIPAHAGKTRPTESTSNAREAHPRSRGENFALTVPMVLAGGSSPLTRGKHGDAAALAIRLRLIPAHAGKTVDSGPLDGLARAHPRSRGENAWRLITSHGRGGSSPLTRGKPATASSSQ